MGHETQIVAGSESLASAMAPHPHPLPDYRERGLSIRPGTLADVPFLDSLQKLHTKQVGWMPTAQFEGKIKLGMCWWPRGESRRGAGRSGARIGAVEGK